MKTGSCANESTYKGTAGPTGRNANAMGRNINERAMGRNFQNRGSMVVLNRYASALCFLKVSWMDDILRYAVLCFAVLICHAMLCYAYVAVLHERMTG